MIDEKKLIEVLESCQSLAAIKDDLELLQDIKELLNKLNNKNDISKT